VGRRTNKSEVPVQKILEKINNDEPVEAVLDSSLACEIVKGKKRAENEAELYEYRIIKHYDESAKETFRTVLTESENRSIGPTMIVKVSGDIIPNHNDIYTSPFVDFISRVVNVGLYRPQ
jgi:hypothetical protein